uniref:Reverse transcriptase domain-containing protein n=1 Tax=Arthrobotrys musiformis TaxID=47236 RepID=A0A482EAL3_9PEZI|nr:hypothetical protein [Arthrobotrys musiformis]
MCAWRVMFITRFINRCINFNIIDTVYKQYVNPTLSGTVCPINDSHLKQIMNALWEIYCQILIIALRNFTTVTIRILDTYWLLWIGLHILSRISRYEFGKLAIIKDSGYDGCLKAKSHSCQESPNKTSVQEPKVKTPHLSSPKLNSEENGNNMEPRELSASTSKRGRSCRSSPKPEKEKPETKDNSKKSSAEKRGTRNNVSLTNQNLRSYVQSKLDQYRDIDGKYNGIVKILADVGFLQFCYMLIKGKPGNMSRGITPETIDGITYKWFEETSNKIKTGGINFSPARRVLIPKPGKKEKRPLGVGSPRDKIIQKGLQIILETIYEPQFLDCSHGFRPQRSTHSALKILHLRAHHYSWVIQGDISKCFDKIPHKVIINLLERQIKCDKILTIIKKTLSVGYKDPINKQITKTDIGTPQGSVLSPLLANIVLHELDKFVHDIIIPENHRGTRRKTNPMYNKIISVRDTNNPNSTKEEREKALKLCRTIPRNDPLDPNYRRSLFLRYADDFVFLFEGPKHEAQLIKEKITKFLWNNTGLELHDEKTIITHLKESFEFLGARIKGLKRLDYRMKNITRTGKVITMRANVRARIDMPSAKIIDKLHKIGFIKKNQDKIILAKPYTKLVNLDHTTILQFFNAKIQGLLNYYTFAGNRVKLFNFIWLLKQSAAKTLARKYKLRSMRQIFVKFGKNLKDPNTDLELISPKSLKAIHRYNCKNTQHPVMPILEQE